MEPLERDSFIKPLDRFLKRGPRPWLIGLGLLAVLVVGCDSTDANRGEQHQASSPGLSRLAGQHYEPDINPDDFVAVIDNPLLPLEPGTIFRLRGETDEGIEHETITVTERTKEILGVTTTVVKDVVRVDGKLAELTHDWYAQDRAGNVWYFGERTAEYEGGKVVSRGGSWQAGVDGAQPGIIMNSDPQVADSYRQEFYRGEAEDMYWVVATGESKSVPFGDFDNVVRTLEWTPLEPNIVVQKFYAPGVGLLAERALSGPKEVVELLEVIR